jgi:large subunit ribosomal protein L17
MFRNMVTSLFKHDRIRTTDAKAKEIRRWADQLVTLAKRGDLHARRQAMAIIQEKDIVHKLFAEAPKRFADVSGGYTRVVKIGFRPGDAAAVSLVELVTPEPKKKKKPRRKKKAAPVAETPQAAVPEVAEVKAPDAEASAEDHQGG